MCELISSLSQNSNSMFSSKKKNLQIFIRPSNEGEYYRFRLLGFKSSSKNDRTDPFIERFVHTHWGKNEEGKPRIDGTVVCPYTKWSSIDKDDCPICKFANNNFIALKESGWKDAEARKNNKEFGRKFEAIIPVYVKNDPNYPQNNGKFKVIIFNDKDFYKEFRNLVKSTQRVCNVFNGKQAVDFYLHMSIVPKIVNEGQPNQYTFNEKKIDKFGFTKAEKAYDIPAITREAMDAMEFDETYYTASTMDEIKEFYSKFIKVNNDDIDEESVKVYEEPKKPVAQKPVAVENVAKPAAPAVAPQADIDDLLATDPDDLPATNEPIAKATPTNDVDDVDSFLNDIMS